MKIVFLSLLIFFVSSSLCLAYDDKITHPHVTKLAIKNSSLHYYAQKYLGLTKSSNNEIMINEKSVSEILKEGSELEDSPDCRAAHHFHNPLAAGDWEAGKLTDSFFVFDILICTSQGDYKYQADWATSNLTWATGYLSINPTEQDAWKLDDNKWDWESARKYYYTSLTGLDYLGEVVAPDRKSRDEYLEKTLRAVGQVAHLLQDTSVPAHVRNDFSQGHLMVFPQLSLPKKWVGNRYEKYLRDNNEELPCWGEGVARYKGDNYYLTNLWDSNQFSESFNGNIAMDNLGLSEYTNMNFFSEYTAISSLYGMESFFPFPKAEHLDIVPDYPATGSLLKRPYIATTGEHPGEKVEHLAVASILIEPLRNFIKGGGVGYFFTSPDNLPIYMDNKCHDAYAKRLIPRAIGYTADLIDYFFRGRIEVSPIRPQDLTIRGDGKGNVSIFDVSVKVRNASMDIVQYGETDNNKYPTYSNENMENGYLHAVANYDVNGTPEYSVSKGIWINAENSIKSDSFLEFKFDFSEDPISWGVNGIDIQVVYDGTLGGEENYAVAVGRRLIPAIDITPPEKYVYSIIDASKFYADAKAQPQKFKVIKANLRPDFQGKEIRSGGTLGAIASYRKLKNYIPDMAGVSSTKSTDREDEVSFSTSAPHAINVFNNPFSSTGESEITFKFSEEQAIPAGITDLYLYIVFEGALYDPQTKKEEPDSLVLGIKDLNEPQHLTFWNDTDYFLLNGVPQEPDKIRDDPTVKEYNVFVEPHDIKSSISFSDAQPLAHGDDSLFGFTMNPGRYSRVILLTDSAGSYWISNFLLGVGEPINPYLPSSGYFFEHSIDRTISQLNIDKIWYSSPVKTIRGVSQHERVYYINCWPALIWQEKIPAPKNDLLPVPASFINFPEL